MGLNVKRLQQAIEAEFGKVFEEQRKVAMNYNWFVTEGYPFGSLPDNQRNQLLDTFSAMLSSYPSGQIYTFLRPLAVRYAGDTFRTKIPEYYVRVPADYVSFFGLKKIKKDPLKERPNVVRNELRMVELETGEYASVIVVYNIPLSLPEAFLHFSLLNVASEIMIKWSTYDQNTAINIIEKAKARKKHGSSIKDLQVYQGLEAMTQRIIGGADLLRLGIFIVVKGDTPQEVNVLSDRVISMLKRYGVSAERPPFVQDELYYFKDVCDQFNIDSWSARAFYPFLAETLDSDGVFLGLSRTGHPILLNLYHKKHNLIFAILGASGSGKSFTIKLFLNRCKKVYPDIKLFIIDPENEFSNEKTSEVLGVEGIMLSDDEKLGLDPIRMIHAGYLEMSQVAEVAEVLASIYHLPTQMTQRLRGLLHQAVTKGTPNIFDFVESLPMDLKDYLVPILSPPDSNIFDGPLPRLSGDRLAFGLRKVRSHQIKLLILSLLSIMILSKTIIQHDERKTIVAIDETWLFKDVPPVLKMISHISRRGRKFGVGLLMATQRGEDLASVEAGRSVLEQAYTKLLLYHPETSNEFLKDVFKLKDDEVKMLNSVSPGEGLLLVGDDKFVLEITSSKDEREAFATKYYK